MGMLFVLSMGIALNPQIDDVYMPHVVEQAITIFWIVFAGGSFARKHLSRKTKNNDFRFLVKAFFCPKLLIWLYGISLFLLGVADRELMSPGLIQITSALLPLCALYLFRQKTVDYVFYACAWSFLAVVIVTCFKNGMGCLAAPFASIVNSMQSNPFENSQFTFTTSFLLVYYLCLAPLEKNRTLKSSLCVVMFLFGYKRILLMAVATALLFFFFCKGLNPQIRARASFCAGFLLFAACWVFIYGLYEGSFFSLMDLLGVNTMGRSYYYFEIVDRTSLDPLFPGLGLNAVSKIFVTQLSYMKVGGVHSDILKYYAEIGFIGFTIWISYYLLILPRMLQSRFGEEVSFGYYVVAVLVFVSYFTDNIDIYMGSQFLYVAIVGSLALFAGNQGKASGTPFSFRLSEKAFA
ncbi:hypothetical protein [Enterorhabdus sp. P55]|uniref:hypothetical protein n=1 Tax=Enterorhabdus sp. P55 TaxID=2304571 RepID=UPI00136A5F23|nr:hypothetical protein [Enterorhabdus sp. P55]